MEEVLRVWGTIPCAPRFLPKGSFGRSVADIKQLGWTTPAALRTGNAHRSDDPCLTASEETHWSPRLWFGGHKRRLCRGLVGCWPAQSEPCSVQPQ
jgi:hypothetical protein